MSQKRKRLSLTEKVEIINIYEKNQHGIRDIAVRFGVGKTQIGNIIKKKNDILKWWNGDENIDKHSFPSIYGSQIDNLTFDWLCWTRSNNLPLNGTIIRKKALQIAHELGFHDFKASAGWLDRFKIRHNISFKNEYSEPPDKIMNEITTSDWKKKLPELCEGYEERNIFNCDTVGLFYKEIPIKRLCTGGKFSKAKLAVLLCVNMIGEFENPLIIGKAAKPKCFNDFDISKLNVEWYTNNQVSMTNEIMTEWLSAFDERMRKQQRNVVLFLGNTALTCSVTLNNVKLIVFPPNTTSACQALDQGIIRNFQIYYRQKVLGHILSRMDNDKFVYELANRINVLDAVLWIIAALKQITTSTVINCFKKAGFIYHNSVWNEIVVNAEPDEDELDQLLDLSADDTLPPDINEYVEVIHRDEDCTDDDEPNEQRYDVNAKQIPHCSVTGKDALEHIQKLRYYFLSEKDEEGLGLICQLEAHVESKIVNDLKTKKKIINQGDSVVA